MKTGLLLLVGAVVLLAAHKPECPAEFRLGMTYKEIQQGPCPGIDSVASFRAEDGIHVGYLCKPRQTMAIGNMQTGKMDAFFLFEQQ